MPTAPVLADGPVIPGFEPITCRAKDVFCWNWVADNSSALLGGLLQHIYLAAIAVAIGFAIALAAALLAFRFPKVETPFQIVSTILYTIPVLAFFLLMVSVTGIGLLTIEIALTGYTLLLLFRNILAGLRSVPPEAYAAAVGMGMTPRQILLKVNLPIALPAIMAGLRVASVTAISLATLAGEIAPLGLGPLFSDALAKSNFVSELVSASVLAIALALVADTLLVLLTRAITPWERARKVSRARSRRQARVAVTQVPEKVGEPA